MKLNPITCPLCCGNGGSQAHDEDMCFACGGTGTVDPAVAREYEDWLALNRVPYSERVEDEPAPF
jgi:hypothetical protein